MLFAVLTLCGSMAQAEKSYGNCKFEINHNNVFNKDNIKFIRDMGGVMLSDYKNKPIPYNNICSYTGKSPTKCKISWAYDSDKAPLPIPNNDPRIKGSGEGFDFQVLDGTIVQKEENNIFHLNNDIAIGDRLKTNDNGLITYLSGCIYSCGQRPAYNLTSKDPLHVDLVLGVQIVMEKKNGNAKDNWEVQITRSKAGGGNCTLIRKATCETSKAPSPSEEGKRETPAPLELDTGIAKDDTCPDNFGND